MFKPIAHTAIAAVLLSLCACVDNNYDLDNIDKTVEVKVNDLVVPVNLEAITLSEVFDLDSGSIIKNLGDEYAVLVDGDFSSNAISIAPVTIAGVGIAPITQQIYKYDGNPTLPPGIIVPVGRQTVSYEVGNAATPFEFSSSAIDPSIRSISELETRWNLTVTITVSDPQNTFEKFIFQNLKLRLPGGLAIEGHTNQGGIVAIPDIVLEGSAKTTIINLPVVSINTAAMGAGEYSFAPGTGGGKGTVKFKGNVGIQSALITAVTHPDIANIPASSSITVAPAMSDLSVVSFSGNLEYQLTDFNIAPVELNDLPDLLMDAGTNITIANPQLYLSVNNPMAQYNVGASTGLILTARRDARPDRSFTTDGGARIEMGYDKGIDGPYSFCLAPSKPGAYRTGYTDASFIGFKELADVLSGEGLPQTIKVGFDSPRVGPGHVTRFKLDGTPLQPVKGRYTFYAPLALGAGSQVVYKGHDTGWNDKTLDKLTVNTLRLDASVDNDLPVDIQLTAIATHTPQSGLPDEVIATVTVPSGSGKKVEMRNTAPIVKLDGVRYEARASVPQDASGKPLRPNGKIKLSNIRVTVGGSYVDTLK